MHQEWETENWNDRSKFMWNYDENNNTTIVEYWRWNDYDENWQQQTLNGLIVYYNNMQSSIIEEAHKITANYIKVLKPSDVEKVESMPISIYPNPTTGELRIESGKLRVENIEIYDVSGRNLSSFTSHSSFFTSINISHLSAGVYFVKISTEAGEVVKKVLKE